MNIIKKRGKLIGGLREGGGREKEMWEGRKKRKKYEDTRETNYRPY